MTRVRVSVKLAINLIDINQQSAFTLAVSCLCFETPKPLPLQLLSSHPRLSRLLTASLHVLT
jgi:hypothetical protein